jgi:hypothetical protein
VPKDSRTLSRELETLAIVANFVEAWLAKAGHPGLVPNRLRDGLALGATGVQTGSALAFCNESVAGAPIPALTHRHAVRGR